jgi:hypothetical protein
VGIRKEQAMADLLFIILDLFFTILCETRSKDENNGGGVRFLTIVFWVLVIIVAGWMQ